MAPKLKPKWSRGGGFLRYQEQGSNGRESYFRCSTRMVNAIKRAGGGLLGTGFARITPRTFEMAPLSSW